MKLAIFSLTEPGRKNAEKILRNFDATYFHMPHENMKLSEKVKDVWNKYNAFLFFMATGIVVRVIAKLIKDKKSDPAVIVVDDNGKFVISLLSGHLGGANNLTKKIASILHGTAVITTSSDINGTVSLDMFAKERNLILRDFDMAKKITAMLINGKKVALFGADDAWFYKGNDYDAAIYITNRQSVEEDKSHLLLYKRNLFLGIGCKKNFPVEDMKKNIISLFDKLGFSIFSVAAIGTIDLKKDEAAIKFLANMLKVPLYFFNSETLSTVSKFFKSSSFVQKQVGVSNVSASAAFLASGKKGKLIFEKGDFSGMTVSIVEVLDE